MDLYHRLNVIHIHVAPLAERAADIPLLSENFCEEICNEYSIPVKKISPGAVEALKSLPWTGNIRELRNVIERLIILSDKTITEENVRAFANPSGSIYHPENAFETKGSSSSSGNGFDYEAFSNFQDFKDHAEMEFIKYKLEKNNWNVSKTAEDIEIQRSHLYSKIDKFGLKRAE
jgi:DNA-binding NtrC family response regulator